MTNPDSTTWLDTLQKVVTILTPLAMWAFAAYIKAKFGTVKEKLTEAAQHRDTMDRKLDDVKEATNGLLAEKTLADEAKGDLKGRADLKAEQDAAIVDAIPEVKP